MEPKRLTLPHNRVVMFVTQISPYLAYELGLGSSLGLGFRTSSMLLGFSISIRIRVIGLEF